MGRRGTRMNVEGLCRFLSYVLARRPDEFGLIPDSDGWIPVKELLQALHEEEGWRYVRQGHINELMMDRGRDVFKLDGGYMKAAERHFSEPEPVAPKDLPKLLYTAVRSRAHPVVMEKGLTVPKGRWLVLSASKSMAIRIGRRKDPEAVILEIGAASAGAGGAGFFSFGDLFLAESLPDECILGPQAPPRPPASPAKTSGPSKEQALPIRSGDFTPGSFTLSPERDLDRGRAAKGRKPRGWKEKARARRKGQQ